jgi:hypothetical protein
VKTGLFQSSIYATCRTAPKSDTEIEGFERFEKFEKFERFERFERLLPPPKRLICWLAEADFVSSLVKRGGVVALEERRVLPQIGEKQMRAVLQFVIEAGTRPKHICAVNNRAVHKMHDAV